MRLAALLFAVALNAAAQQPQVAITFDDLPAHGPLPPGVSRRQPVKDILATLKKENLPPVYGFVNGFRVRDYPYQVEILQAWHAAGEPLGNHTFEHPNLDEVSAKSFIADIARNEPILKKVDPDRDWHWFRFPFLDEGNTLAKRQAVRSWLLDHHYRIAEVTYDFEDSLWNDPYARCMAKQQAGIDETANIAWLEESYLDKAAEFAGVFRDLSKKLYNRDIPYVLLLHVGAFDAHMFPRLIAQLRSEGFTFITLEQAQSDPAYAFDPNIGYPGGGTLEELVAHTRGIDFPDNTKPYTKLDALCR